MTKLRDGSSLLAWRREAGFFITAVGPGLEPVVLGNVSRDEIASLDNGDVSAWRDQLGEHAVDGEPTLDDPITLERLAAADRTFGGWLPGIMDAEAARIGRAEAMASRRRLFSAPRIARPVLPFSVARRAGIVEALNPGRVALDDDADGLSILLAESGIETVTVERDPIRKAWLEREAARAGVAAHRVVEDARSVECDTAIVAIGPPHETLRALTWACGAVGPGGHILAGIRAPWDEHFFTIFGNTGLSLRDHVRGIDSVVIPGGFVIDGPGDLLVFERPAEVSLPTLNPSAGARVREQPYYWLDFDELAAPRLGETTVERLADLVAAQHPAPEVMRAVSQSEGRELICWFDNQGKGLTAQLATDARHLLVTMMPYDLELEYNLMCAVFHLLGDHLTRVRPQLPMRWRGESIVA